MAKNHRYERKPPAEWHALIRDAHSGYITWEEYSQIQEQLQTSAKALHMDRRQPTPREGPALLQGRAVCGLCGNRMHVRCTIRGDERRPTYVCVSAHGR